AHLLDRPWETAISIISCFLEAIAVIEWYQEWKAKVWPSPDEPLVRPQECVCPDGGEACFGWGLIKLVFINWILITT
ncbi:MAG TPA: hypothetical protein VHC50_01130, partial [Puia sp.]|nr:hypothetical protein [Puia sp.]